MRCLRTAHGSEFGSAMASAADPNPPLGKMEGRPPQQLEHSRLLQLVEPERLLGFRGSRQGQFRCSCGRVSDRHSSEADRSYFPLPAQNSMRQHRVQDRVLVTMWVFRMVPVTSRDEPA